MTPEGKIKAKVRAILDATPMCYYDMPVPGGYGMSALDFNCCVRGQAVYIETKADPSKTLSPRQRDCALRMLAAGAKVFIVAGPDGLQALRRYLSDLLARRTKIEIWDHLDQ